MPLAIVSPIKRARFHCNISSKSTREKKLEETVKKLTKQVTTLKEHVSALQATVILQGRYCDRVRRHLETQEKKGCREGDNVKLNGDGMPRLLTSDEVFEQVLVYQERQQAKAAEKETRKAARMVRTREMELWMQEDEARKNRNKAKTEQWKVAVKEWEVEQRLAKQEKRKPQWKKPVRGPLEKPCPKPKNPRRNGGNIDEEDGQDQGEFIDIHEGSICDDSEYEDDDEYDER
jgi:superfamily II DNA helicase RecQ